jgi:uncharacterized protein YbjT (DUF2867 family)
MIQAVDNNRAVNKTLEVGGPKVYRYVEIMAILKRALNKKRQNVYLPLWLVKVNAAILEVFFKPAPITRDQLTMLNAGSVCDNSQVFEIFNIKLTEFEDSLKYMRW